MADSIKIMKRTVDALKSSGARYVAWDTDLPGFGVRVGTTGSKTYVLKYRVGGGRAGRVRWGVIGQHGVLTPDQARETAHRWAAEVAAGGDPAGEKIDKRKAPTVAELMGDYLSRHVKVRNKPSTIAYVTDLVQRIICKDPLAKLKVSDVASADIARFHARLSKTPTRLLTDAERAVFAGVVETRHGTHYRFHNQVKALKELAKRLGFNKARDDRNTNAVARLILDLQTRGQMQRMQLRLDRDPCE